MSVRDSDSVDDLLPFPQRHDMARLDAQISYLLMCAALVVALVGAIHDWFFLFAAILWACGGGWALLKKREARQTLSEGHFDNIIFVLSLSLALVPMASLLAWYFESWVPLALLWLWAALRMSLALLRLVEQRGYHCHG